MAESNVMKELRSIRDENSARHLAMTLEERAHEFAKATEWFLKAMDHQTKVIELPKYNDRPMASGE